MTPNRDEANVDPSRWGVIDARSLAMFRISFGVVLLLDVLTRWPVLREFYTNDGWLTNHYALFSQPGVPQFSLLFALATPAAVHMFFAITAALSIAFIVGYRQRGIQALLFLCVLSIHARNYMVPYGFDIVTHVLLIWSAFLPLESVWSVDARVGRARRSGSRIAAVGIVVQVAVIYLLNGLNKTGETWTGGEAVHYLFWQDAIARTPAVWAREVLPVWMLKAMSYGTLFAEVAGAALLVSWWRRSACRLIAVVMLGALHLGIWMTVNVGLFSLVMVSTYWLFAGERTWAWLSARLRRWPEWGTRVSAPPPSLGAASPAGELAPGLWALTCALMLGPGLQFLPAPSRPTNGPFLQSVAQVFKVSQTWSLFGPEAPTEEGLFVVVALTQDGREVDPYRGGAPLNEIPEAYGAWLAQEWVGHSIRMRKGWFPGLREDFERRLWQHHELTGNPDDLILGYKAYNLHRPSPKPGEREAVPATKTLIHQARRPGL